MQNIEAQIIVREKQGFGLTLFKATLENIEPHVEKIVLVDNECDDAVRDMYHSVIPNNKLEVVIIKGYHPYSLLRNLGLSRLNSKYEWVLFSDSDELFCDQIFIEAEPLLKEKLNFIFIPLNYLVSSPFTISMHWTRKHYVSRTVGFWRKTPGAYFNGDVHETFLENNRSIATMIKTPCIHFWTRPQWQQTLKSLRYSYLETGSFERTADYFREYDATPNNFKKILFEKMGKVEHYNGSWYGLTDFINKCGSTYEEWEKYLKTVEDYSFWHLWQELYQEKGNWIDTFKVVYDKFYL